MSPILDEIEIFEVPEKTTVAVLEERLYSHEVQFRSVVGVAIAWLAALSLAMYNMNGTLGRVEIAQADAPEKTVAAVLARSQGSRSEMAGGLAAAATILKTTKPPTVNPQSGVIKDVIVEIVKAQTTYPDLPETWQATTAFVNYKSTATLPTTVEAALHRAAQLDCSGNGRMTTSGGTVIISGCALDLEHAVKADKVLFVDSVIRYHGGQIPVTHATFRNCVFEFDISGEPSAAAKTLLSQLTSATTSQFEVRLG